MMKRFMLVIGLVLLWGVVFPNANAASLSEQQKKENRRREMIRANSRTRNQGIGFVVEPPKKEPQTYTRPSEPIKFEFRGSTNVSHAVFNDLYKDTVLSQYANNGRYFYNRKIPRWVNSGSQKNIQMVKAISNQTYVVIEDAQNLFVLRLPTFVCPCRFDFLEPIGLLTRQTPARYSYQDEKGYIKSVPILEGEYVLSMSDKAHPAITEAEANDLFEKGYRFVLLGQLTDTTQYLYGIRSNNTQQGTLDDLFVADTNINTNCFASDGTGQTPDIG